MLHKALWRGVVWWDKSTQSCGMIEARKHLQWWYGIRWPSWASMVLYNLRSASTQLSPFIEEMLEWGILTEFKNQVWILRGYHVHFVRLNNSLILGSVVGWSRRFFFFWFERAKLMRSLGGRGSVRRLCLQFSRFIDFCFTLHYHLSCRCGRKTRFLTSTAKMTVEGVNWLKKTVTRLVIRVYN